MQLQQQLAAGWLLVQGLTTPVQPWCPQHLHMAATVSQTLVVGHSPRERKWDLLWLGVQVVVTWHTTYVQQGRCCQLNKQQV